MWDNVRFLNAAASTLYGVSAVMIIITALAIVVRLPIFPLRGVDVTGHVTHVTIDQVRAIASEQLTGNFFTIDLDAARAAFQKLPWVRQATVRRQWPDRLRVDVQEHIVLARWRDAALVNTYGEVFEAATNESLPVFSAPDGTAAEVTQHYQTFRSSLESLGKTPVQVVLSTRRAWQVRLSDGSMLELGRNQMEERLQRFVSVYSGTVAHFPHRPYHIDLRYPNGFAVRVPSAARGV